MARQSIGKESVEGITPDTGPAHGHTEVGTAAVQLVAKTFTDTLKGVLIVSDGSNSAIIYIGRKGVTADNDTDTGGVPLPAGTAIFLPVEDPTRLFVISTASNQDVAWMSI